MSQPAEPTGPAGPAASLGATGHARLRTLLLGEVEAELNRAHAEIERLRQELDSAEACAARTARALPAAIDSHAGEESALQQALQPDYERMLFRSVRERPDAMAEAIYPLLGPAIRKIIERLFSPSRDKDAQPFNVEQLFLIHRISGLLIAHTEADKVVSADPDMVSGMLSAIRAYVQDAFGSGDSDGLRVMHVGEVMIRVEWGPRAVLAAVVRGIEPPQLQPALEAMLADVHLEHGDALDNHDGEEALFDDLPLRLRSGMREHAPADTRGPLARHARALLLGAVALCVVGYAAHLLDSTRWQEMIGRLNAEPGLVVISSDRSERSVRLLADPGARPPATVVAGARAASDGDLEFIVYPYLIAPTRPEL